MYGRTRGRRPGERQRWLVGATVCLAGLIFPAWAADDAEPNDRLVQAEGPVGGGAPLAGSLPAGDQGDWYLFTRRVSSSCT